MVARFLLSAWFVPQVLAVGRASQLDMRLAFARELMGGFSNRTASAAASISTPLTHFLEFLLQVIRHHTIACCPS